MGNGKKIGIGVGLGILGFFLFVFVAGSMMIEEEEMMIQEHKQNIIVIMADDLDLNSFNLLLSENMLPNIENYLISDGSIFTNSFVTISNCCPSRATFLTGLYAHNHEVHTNDPELNGSIVAFDDNSSIAVFLNAGNYRTGLIGKYLNGYGKFSEPTYIPPGWSDWKALIDPFTYSMYDYKINDNGIIIDFGNETNDYQTDVLASYASDFIQESKLYNDQKPFFLLITPVAPHNEVPFPINKCVFSKHSMISGIQSPPRYYGTTNHLLLSTIEPFNEKDVEDKPPWIQELPILNDEDVECLNEVQHGRLEATRGIDDLVGTVIDSLKNNNKLENSIIIFTSDNGLSIGEHRVFGKRVPYDESIRVPLIIKDFSKKLPAIDDRLVINTDFAPTFLEIAGIKTPETIDGRALMSYDKDVSGGWREYFLIEYWSDSIKPNVTTFAAVRSHDYLYVEYETGETEFYDLKTDPLQLNNQFDCELEICLQKINSLKNILTKLKTCNNRSCQIFEN